MFSIGWFELLLVATLALLIFGADDLPVIARQIARVVGQVQRMFSVLQRDWQYMTRDQNDDTQKPKDKNEQ